MKFTVEYKKLIGYEVQDIKEEFTDILKAKSEAQRLTVQGEVLGHATVFMLLDSGTRTKVNVFGSEHAI